MKGNRKEGRRKRKKLFRNWGGLEPDVAQKEPAAQ